MFKRIVGIAFIAVAVVVIVGLVAALVVWRTRGPALAGKLGQLAQDYIIGNDSTRIEISNMSGNPLGSLTLHDVKMSVRDGEKWVSFVSSPVVKLEFDISKMSRTGVEFRSVEVERPTVHVARGRLGKHLWPRFKKKKGEEGGPGFGILIEKLSLEGGSLTIDRRADDLVFDDIRLSTSLSRDSAGIHFGNLRGNLRVLPWDYEIMELTGSLLLDGGDVSMDSLTVRTTSSAVNVGGRLGLGGGKKTDLEILIEALSLAEMREFDVLSFLPREGVLVGTARVLRENGATRVLAQLQGEYGEHPVESLRAATDVRKGRWQSEFRLVSNESIVEGTFRSGPGESQESAIDFHKFDPGEWPEVFGQENVPRGSLDGSFRFSGKSLTSAKRQGLVRVSLDPGHYAGFSFLNATAAAEFDGEGRLLVRSAEFSGHGYDARAAGSLGPEGALGFEFESRVRSAGEFSWLKEKFDFRADFRVVGKLTGDGKTLGMMATVEGPLEGTLPRTVSGDMQQGLVTGRLWPSLSLEARVWFAPARVFGVVLDSLQATTLIAEAGAGEGGEKVSPEGGGCGPVEATLACRARAVRADSTLEVEATVNMCGGETQVDVVRLALQPGETVWSNERPVQLGWKEGKLEVSDLTLRSDAGRVSVRATYEPETRKASGDVEATFVEVSAVLGRFLPLAGRLESRLQFALEETAPRLEAEIDWRDAAFSGTELGNLSLSLGASEREITLRKFELTKNAGKVGVTGTVSLEGGIGEFMDTLLASHVLPPGTAGDLDISVEGFELAELSSHWEDSLFSLGGRVDGHAKIQGLLDDPRISVWLKGSGIRIKEYEVSRIDGEATLEGGVCTLSQLGLVEKGARGEVRGTFPLSVNLRRGRVSIPDGRLSMDVRLPESDFSVASLFIRQIASSSGRVKGMVKIAGTVRNPTVDGAFDITNATLRLAGREEVLEGLNAAVTLDETAVKLVKFSAKQGEDGQLEGSGAIYLGETEQGRYNFVVKGKKVTFGDPEDMAMKFDCDLVISSVEVKDRGTIPKITGNIYVKQGVILREFQTGVGSGQDAPWFCDLQLEIPNNLWLKNINAEIELAGSLTARKDTGGLILLGSLRVLRGKYYVFDNEFRIVSGGLEFKDVGRIDPELSIEAETSVSGRRIFLSLSGKLSEPNIKLSSDDPNLGQTDILRLITVGKYVDVAPGESTDGGLMPGVTGSVGNYFLRQIERRMARELKWVDSIEFGGSLEGGSALSELRWGLGKYITPELYLRYSQGLIKTSERDVSIEYRLSDLFFLRGGVVSRDRLTGKDRDEYSLDLRLKYEY